MTPVEILRALVAIPTVSSASNVPLIDWVVQFLQPLGWHCHVLPYTDENGIAKANLLARPSQTALSDAIALAFFCHTDTVPPAVRWSDPYTLRMEAAHAHGLGSCDVKSALACFLAAIVTAPSDPLNPGLALILTADEEIGCRGVDRLLAALPDLRIQRAIISEPTSLCPAVAGKGYGLARVRLRGREAHSAFPREGISAIAAAAALIPRILAAQTPTTHDLFDPPRTTFNIGTITGGTAKNIIPGASEFLVEWRAVPTDQPGTIPALLQKILDDTRPSIPGIAASLEILRDEPGFDRAAATPLADHLAAALGRPLTGISFGSEATRIAHIAEEILVLGPGDMHTAHSDRECVPLTELDEWTQTLRDLFCHGF